MKHIFLKYNHLDFTKICYACFLIAGISMISSCKKNLYNQQKENKLVVLAEITADDSAYIPVAQSLIAGNGNPISFEKVNNASVTIVSQNGTANQLKFNNSSDFNGNPATIYSHAGIFQNNTD